MFWRSGAQDTNRARNRSSLRASVLVLLRPLRMVLASAVGHPFGRGRKPLVGRDPARSAASPERPDCGCRDGCWRSRGPSAATDPAPARVACRARFWASRSSRCPARAGGPASSSCTWKCGSGHGRRAAAVSPSARACGPAPHTSTGPRARAPWPRVRPARRSFDFSTAVKRRRPRLPRPPGDRCSRKDRLAPGRNEARNMSSSPFGSSPASIFGLSFGSSFFFQNVFGSSCVSLVSLISAGYRASGKQDRPALGTESGHVPLRQQRAHPVRRHLHLRRLRGQQDAGGQAARDRS